MPKVVNPESISTPAQQVLEQIQDLEAAIATIDSKLKSRDFMQTFGIGAQDLQVPVQDLLYMPLEKLSKGDLGRLKQHHMQQLEKLKLQIKTQSILIAQLSKKAQQLQNISAAKAATANVNVLLKQYNSDHNEFFATVLLVQPINSHTKQEIYASADKIIAVCSAFEADTDPAKILLAWEIVAAARDIASDNKYTAGANQMFSSILEILPSGMQGLKFLYDAKAYSQVDAYLFRPVTPQLAEELTNAINNANLKIAQDVLLENVKFKRLPLDVQQKLIEQQAYVNQLNFDLSYIKDADKFSALIHLKSYAQSMEDNIRRTVGSYQEYKDFAQTFNELQLNVEQRASELIDKISGKKTLLMPKIGSGLGGLAWLYGFGVATNSEHNKRAVKL